MRCFSDSLKSLSSFGFTWLLVEQNSFIPLQFKLLWDLLSPQWLHDCILITCIGFWLHSDYTVYAHSIRNLELFPMIQKDAPSFFLTCFFAFQTYLNIVKITFFYIFFILSHGLFNNSFQMQIETVWNTYSCI